MQECNEVKKFLGFKVFTSWASKLTTSAVTNPTTVVSSNDNGANGYDPNAPAITSYPTPVPTYTINTGSSIANDKGADGYNPNPLPPSSSAELPLPLVRIRSYKIQSDIHLHKNRKSSQRAVPRLQRFLKVRTFFGDSFYLKSTKISLHDFWVLALDTIRLTPNVCLKSTKAEESVWSSTEKLTSSVFNKQGSSLVPW